MGGAAAMTVRGTASVEVVDCGARQTDAGQTAALPVNRGVHCRF